VIVTVRADRPTIRLRHVGMPGIATVVYLGNGWVLTANHVVDGRDARRRRLPARAGLAVTFTNPDLSVPDSPPTASIRTRICRSCRSARRRPRTQRRW
jgi:hypothetical protein